MISLFYVEGPLGVIFRTHLVRVKLYFRGTWRWTGWAKPRGKSIVQFIH